MARTRSRRPRAYCFAEGCENTASSQFPPVGSEQIQGKPLSYNNDPDADAAWNLVREFDEPAGVILKHQNPCGSAAADVASRRIRSGFRLRPEERFWRHHRC